MLVAILTVNTVLVISIVKIAYKMDGAKLYATISICFSALLGIWDFYHYFAKMYIVAMVL